MSGKKKWRKLDEVRAEREAIAAKARRRIEGNGEWYEVELIPGLEPTKVFYKTLSGEWITLNMQRKETK